MGAGTLIEMRLSIDQFDFEVSEVYMMLARKTVMSIMMVRKTAQISI